MSTLLCELVETAITEHNLRRTMASCGTPEEFIETAELVLLYRVRALLPEEWTKILSIPVPENKHTNDIRLWGAKRAEENRNKKDLWRPRIEGISKADLEVYLARKLALMALTQLLAEHAEA